MQTFIKENWGLLRISYVSSMVIGWLLMVLFVATSWVHTQELLHDEFSDMTWFEYYTREIPWNDLDSLPMGILVLAIGQFIKFFYDRDSHPGWVLKNLTVLITLFILITLIRESISFTLNYSYQWHAPIERWVLFPLKVLCLCGKVLVLLGITLTVKRVLPLIEESRTLI
jgi:hypothetical protein